MKTRKQSIEDRTDEVGKCKRALIKQRRSGEEEVRMRSRQRIEVVKKILTQSTTEKHSQIMRAEVQSEKNKTQLHERDMTTRKTTIK